MKIVIIIGMVIIFISSFFMLLIFDRVIKDQIRCMAGLEAASCDYSQTGKSLVMGIALIAMFLIIDSGVLYIIIKSITESGSSYIAYSI